MMDKLPSLLALLLGCDSGGISTMNLPVTQKDRVAVSHRVNKLNNIPFIHVLPFSISCYTLTSYQDILGLLPK